ncbi:hypothetical protein [Klebsiella sp. BIGb0407]|uniref:hypothetical protein n=1 Tax=Klebsiella sp. BIGb0407 TaxID=2940603 RepID=UPI002169A2DA|nr:hypothetical protein [Klebsiella sp. BIGb0407]MCS3433669.1 hypothetical protein [Klebsiella sp. BIGb0407]
MNNLSNKRLAELANKGMICICQDEEYQSMARELLARREAAEKPIAWTDEQELRDVERDGCGYLFTVNPITPHADMRRVIPLFTVPPLTDGADYKSLVMEIAEIAHGSRTDINLLLVTIRSLQQRCASIKPPATETK